MDLNLLPYTLFHSITHARHFFERSQHFQKKKKKEKERNSKSHFPKILKNHSFPDKGAFFFARIFVLRMDRSIEKHARNDRRASVGRRQLNRRDNGHWSPVIVRYYA